MIIERIDHISNKHHLAKFLALIFDKKCSKTTLWRGFFTLHSCENGLVVLYLEADDGQKWLM